MIFVTVGTHEQPFNRLIEKLDLLIEKKIINEEVIVQKGFTSYSSKYCRCYDVISFDDMKKYQDEARIIITHGGPASFLYVLSIGKIPIVVPRQKKFNEHVNDHQLLFLKELVTRGFPLIVIDDINELEKAIIDYKNNDGYKFKSNNEKFMIEFENLVYKLFE